MAFHSHGNYSISGADLIESNSAESFDAFPHTVLTIIFARSEIFVYDVL